LIYKSVQRGWSKLKSYIAEIESPVGLLNTEWAGNRKDIVIIESV